MRYYIECSEKEDFDINKHIRKKRSSIVCQTGLGVEELKGKNVVLIKDLFFILKISTAKINVSKFLTDRRVFPGHLGLIQVGVNWTQLPVMDFVIAHAAVVLKMTLTILKLAMTTRRLYNVYQENVSIFNVIVICIVNHLV